MGLREFWKNYKVLIVMGTSLGLIHWGWYNLKANPLLHKTREDYIPEPGIVAYVSPPAAAAAPAPTKSKGVGMKPQSWLRKNWLWAAGGAFITIHVATWLMQRAMRSAVRSEAALKQKTAEERLD